MQEWFKYEYGYVNIDDEHLYLTNSGNWSETINLREKSRAVNSRNENKTMRMVAFLVVVYGFFGYMIVNSMINGRVGITLLILTVGGGYKMYDYIRHGIGAKFKIPLVKISGFTVLGNTVEIEFTDGEGNIDQYKLHKVEEKGLGIIHSLQKKILNMVIQDI